MKKRSFIILLLGTVLLVSCKKKDSTSEEPSDCDKNPSTFSAKVKPIIQTNCAISGCHAAGSNNGPGALTNYTEVKNASARIKVSVSNGSMPKNGSLSEADKNAIICWIDAGAADN